MTRNRLNSPSPYGSRGKDPKTGRFLPGNKCSPGNPAGGRIERLRHLLLNATSDDEFLEIVEVLKERARRGDLKAIDLLFNRIFGRPMQSVHVVGEQPNPDDRFL